ncbi:hypothetical protein Gotri_026564 [Gossypium trilobum]|uniref:Uncharacterized protein n=1 Tax=Gossypium trilobum TaxID=34281 RepID=A0A7J9FM76_9ROSI|nr:hypothetical protein [Gossypium trilobum]
MWNRLSNIEIHNQGHCNHTHCSNPLRFPKLPIITGIITVGFVCCISCNFPLP